jgi:hypothetical protein
MSLGYWGIVTGLVALVATLLISIDIFYRPSKSPGAEEGKTRPRRGEPGSPHKQKDVA